MNAPENGNPGQWAKPIDSIDAVCDAIKFLKYPHISMENIKVLSTRPEKGRFKKALEECLGIHGHPPSVETQKYLYGLTACLSGEMILDLEQIGIANVPFDVLLEIGKTNGAAFRQATKAAINPTHPKHDLGLSVVSENISTAAALLGIEFHAAAKAKIKAEDATTNASTTPTTSYAAQSQSRVSLPPRNTLPENPPSRLPAQDTSKPTTNSSAGEVSKWLSTHAYGSKAALCFNAGISPDNAHVVRLDAALAIGEKRYDWAKAIKIQLGHKELPLLFSVLVGWRNGVKFGSHGKQNDKSFEIVRQEGGFFAKVSAKNETVRAVPITSLDAYAVMTVTLTQILRQAPDELKGNTEVVLKLIKAANDLDANRGNRQEPQNNSPREKNRLEYAESQ